MNLDKILPAIGIPAYTSYTEIYGGKDSSVIKIVVQDGTTYYSLFEH